MDDGAREVMKQEIKRTIAAIIEMDASEIDDDAHFIEDMGIDSLLALEMLAEFERKYQIEIPEEALPEFTCVNRVVDVVLQRVGAERIEDVLAAAQPQA